MQDAFRDIYHRRVWGPEGDGSGGGSEPDMTITTRQVLLDFVSVNGLKSMLDAPCGACKWTQLLWKDIRTVQPDFVYHGVDIVPEIILRNIDKYQNATTTFGVCNIVTDPIPDNYDVILCRDALQHLSYMDVYHALQNFKKTKFKWLLLGSYIPGNNYSEQTPASYPINLSAYPFNLQPNDVLCEKTPIPPCKYLFAYSYETFQQLPIDAILARIQ